MTRFVVTEHASTDEADILQYLARGVGLRVALDYRERFRSTYPLLIEQPGIGSPRPRLGRNVRLSVVAPYLVFYQHAGMP